MDEIWKDIKGYEGKYQISNRGRIKSIRYIAKYNGYIERIMKPGDNGRGYLTTVIGRKGNAKTVKIHRLVAEAFIPNPNNLSEVNHIDGNKKNNIVENLEWVSHKENMIHAHKAGLTKDESKLSRREIDFMRKNYIPKDSQFGICAFARKTGLSSSHIARIIHGKVCKIKHFDSSAIKDGWCVCPKCETRLFKVPDFSYIEHWNYKCDNPKCGCEFEINTPVLDKYVGD